MLRPLKNFDCIVIGGGPVGFIFAASLLKAIPSLKIALIERLSLRSIIEKEHTDNRTTTLSAYTCDILSKLDIWESLSPYTVAMKKISVTDREHTSSKLVFEKKVTEKPFGYTINNTILRCILTKKLTSLNNLTIFDSETIEGIKNIGPSIEVSTQKRKIEAPLLVAADGRFSQTRSLLNFSLTKRSYNQAALVGLLEHTLPHNYTAFEIFHPNGPIAFLPYQSRTRKKNVSAFVFCDTPKTIKALQESSKDFSLNFLRTKTPLVLGDLVKVYGEQSFNLELGKATPCYKERAVLIGDAAQYIHPVAGQGLNLGVRDAVTLAKHLEKTRNLGLDIGSKTTLELYHNQRRRDVLPMIGLTHSLIHLFGFNNPVISFGRRFGFSQINKNYFLKNFLARKAMGY